MYGNYNSQFNVDRINNQIRELENLRNNYQNQAQMQHQQPVTNIINAGNSQICDFEARILNENEKPEEILVQRKTALIDLKNGQLSIKELNGDMKQYEIVLPKTKEQLKIEELERRIAQYELSTTNGNDVANKENVKSTKNSDTRATKDV